MTPLQIISQSKEAETDRRVWKIVLLGFLGTGASVASVSGFNHLLLGLNPFYLWPTIIAFAFFLILTMLQIFLIKGLEKLSLIAFVESAAPLALFWDKLYPQVSVILVLGAVFIFVFLFAAARRGRSFLENSVKIKFFEISRSFLPKAVMGFLLFAAVLLYLNYFEWGNFNSDMGRRLTTGVLMNSEPIVKIIVPGVSFDLTVRELLRTLAAEQLKNTRLQIEGVSASSPETDFRALPKRDQEKLITQATDQLQSIMISKFGNVGPNEKITDFAYALASKYFSDSLKNSAWILPLAVTLIFFFALKGIFALFYWLFILLAFLVFKLLVLFGFAYFNLETRSREFVLLS